MIIHQAIQQCFAFITAFDALHRDRPWRDSPDALEAGIDRFREIAAACPVAIKPSDVTTSSSLGAEAWSRTQSFCQPAPTGPACTHKPAGSVWWDEAGVMDVASTSKR